MVFEVIRFFVELVFQFKCGGDHMLAEVAFVGKRAVAIKSQAA